jgi:putative tryptophan/tyrosine transport system substrate-binding protein
MTPFWILDFGFSIRRSKHKKIFCLAFWPLLFALCAPVHAQQGTGYHIAVLLVGTTDIPVLSGLRDGLKDFGYVQGKNMSLDVSAKANYDELRPLVKSYKEKKIDTIVTIGGTATGIAKELAPDIPTVFIFGSDPVQAGFVKSIARPETNLTGLTTRTGPEIEGKRLELFREAVPTMSRVSVLYNARGENPGHMANLEVLRRVGPGLGLKIQEKPIKAPGEVDDWLRSVSKETTDGIFVISSSMFRSLFGNIARVAMQKKLAVMGTVASNAIDDGTLLFYDSNRYRIGQRAAWYVDRILKGTKPQDLPVESPSYFELIINLKTAKQIGITISPNVLARADRVIR